MAFLFSAAHLSRKYNQKILFGIIYTIPSIIGTIVFISGSQLTLRPAPSRETNRLDSGANPERHEGRPAHLILVRAPCIHS